MANYKLIGKDFIPPDLVGKVTGKAKFAEDFRAQGMLFAKLLRSPMPHGKVRKIDSRKALAMKGVAAILTADDVPKVKPPIEPMLTNEPLYAGEPFWLWQLWMRPPRPKPSSKSGSIYSRFLLS